MLHYEACGHMAEWQRKSWGTIVCIGGGRRRGRGKKKGKEGKGGKREKK